MWTGFGEPGISIKPGVCEVAEGPGLIDGRESSRASIQNDEPGIDLQEVQLNSECGDVIYYCY